MPQSTTKKLMKSIDRTSSQRATNHLIKLDLKGGQRLVVDLDQKAVKALAQLLENGYGATKKEVVNRAIIEAASTKYPSLAR